MDRNRFIATLGASTRIPHARLRVLQLAWAAAVIFSACASEAPMPTFATNAFEPSPTEVPRAQVIPSAEAPLSRYLSGTADPEIPAGVTRSPEVVEILPFWQPKYEWQGGSLDVAIRNNGRSDIYEVRLTAIARDDNGSIVGSGESYGHAFPVEIRPGEIGFASLGFEVTSMPLDATYEFTLSWKDWSPKIDLLPEEWNILEDRVVGTLRNTADVEAQFPTLSVACFEDGQLIDVRSSASPGTAGYSAPPGGQFGFTFILAQPECVEFLVAGRA